MKILLDTHIFIWATTSPELLSVSTTSHLQDTSNVFYLSVASIWEMQIKINLGKLRLSGSLPNVVKKRQQESGLQILPIELRHIYALSTLPAHHRDPFDRLLIAQSQTEKMPLLTADVAFAAYDVDVLN
jgi:PIN domain nuclease of toxin-antitoxin system